MITFDEAYAKAKEYKEKIDGCTEYEKGYRFSYSGDNGYIGGNGHISIVVLKDNGKVISMPEFLMGDTGEYIRDFSI